MSHNLITLSLPIVVDIYPTTLACAVKLVIQISKYCVLWPLPLLVLYCSIYLSWQGLKGQLKFQDANTMILIVRPMWVLSIHMKWKYRRCSLQGAGLPCTQILKQQTMLKVGFLSGKKPLLPLWNDKPYLVNSALVFWMTSVNLLLVVSWLTVFWATTGKWYIGLVALLPPAVCHHVPLLMFPKGLKIPAEECAVFLLTIIAYTKGNHVML